jgi:hypothetical protein
VIPAADDVANEDGVIVLEDEMLEELVVIAVADVEVGLREIDVTRVLSRVLLLEFELELVPEEVGEDDVWLVLLLGLLLRALVLARVVEGVVEAAVATGVELGVIEKIQLATWPSNVAEIQEVCACDAAPKSRTIDTAEAHFIVLVPEEAHV